MCHGTPAAAKYVTDDLQQTRIALIARVRIRFRLLAYKRGVPWAVKWRHVVFFYNNLASCMDTHNSNLNMLIQRRAPKRRNRKKKKKII